jgi:ACS family hexuronate transporter-like MFS transporter
VTSDTQQTTHPHQTEPASALRAGHFRWGICALLFFATTINYIDRQVLGLLKGPLQSEFKFSERDYAAIVFSFQLAYAIGLVLAGRVMDRLGTRRGLALAVAVWSVAGHGLTPRRIGFQGCNSPLCCSAIRERSRRRLLLRSSCSQARRLASRSRDLRWASAKQATFPRASKPSPNGFPRRERAFATGLFNSGSNVGAIITPLTVPWIASHWGWQWAFIATGAIGFLWLAFWLPLYRPPAEHPSLSRAELDLIRSDPPDRIIEIPWRKLLRHRQTWAFALGKFMTDPIWWLYLFWVPDFLKTNHGLNLGSIGLPIVAIYLVADVGSIGGGWLSSWLIRRGWTVNSARKAAMLLCAMAVVPIAFAGKVSNLWGAVALVSLAAAAHQGWSANLFTLTSDMFPRRAVGSVVGIGGTAGAVGGMFMALIVGEILQRTGSYRTIFIIAGSAYLIALTIIHFLVPKLKPAEV